MLQVLRSTRSASERESAGRYSAFPRSAIILAESPSFIWHPNVSMYTRRAIVFHYSTRSGRFNAGPGPAVFSEEGQAEADIFYPRMRKRDGSISSRRRRSSSSVGGGISPISLAILG